MKAEASEFKEETSTFTVVGRPTHPMSTPEGEAVAFVEAMRDRLSLLSPVSQLQVEFGTRTKIVMRRASVSDQESFLVVRGEINTHNVRTPFLWQAARIGKIFAMKHVDDIALCLVREVAAAKNGVALDSTQHQDVVLEPWLASQFIHETVGHSLEHDNFVAYGMQAGWRMGMTLSCDSLHVSDDPTLPGIRGGYAEDDEGSPAERVSLIESGQVVGTLTSLAWGQRSNGHGRLSSLSESPKPRAAISTVRPGKWTREELVAGVERGLLCGGVWGGGSQGDTFVVRPVYARVIKDGKLTDQHVRRFDLAGTKRKYLSAIDAIADDVTTFQPRYGCVKDSGGMIPVGFRAPTIRIRAVPIIPISR